MRFIIDLLYLLAGLAFSPILVYRMVRFQRYRRGWGHRFGWIGRNHPQKKCIWLHAVSVGEVNAAKTLLSEIEKRFPDYEIAVSTTTDTGFARATAMLAGKWPVFYFPFDYSMVMSRAFNRLRPSLCLLMELEVWPNFIATAHRRRIPVAVINGRISDKSFSRYRRIKWFTRLFFGRIDLVLAQTRQYAERFQELGCPADHVIATGSLKYDTAQVADRVDGSDQLAQQLNLSSAKLWVAGGTGDDEEKIILDVYQQLIRQPAFADLQLVVVPRKPERFDEVANLIKQAGFDLIRYSERKKARSQIINPQSAIRNPVVLGDTMGDLRKFYSLATVIFVGRSLVPMGGSDMMEAAALGKCTLFGPHTFNFNQTVEVLLAEQGAIQVNDAQELLAAMEKCLRDPSYAGGVASRGRQVIKNNQGATAKTLGHIMHLLSISSNEKIAKPRI
jgi:3-deoxy-D-manno-octulosonic-acid transferase